MPGRTRSGVRFAVTSNARWRGWFCSAFMRSTSFTVREVSPLAFSEGIEGLYIEPRAGENQHRL